MANEKNRVAGDPHAAPTAVPLAPHLTIAGARAALEFYERAFAAKSGYVQETPDGRVMHAELHLPQGGVFFLCDDFPDMGGSRAPKTLGGSPVTIHLNLTDVDEVWKRALAAGAKVEMELADQFWGARYGVISDPFGHRWSLATQKRDVSRTDLDAAAKGFQAQ